MARGPKRKNDFIATKAFKLSWRFLPFHCSVVNYLDFEHYEEGLLDMQGICEKKSDPALFHH